MLQRAALTEVGHVGVMTYGPASAFLFEAHLVAREALSIESEAGVSLQPSIVGSDE